MKDMVSALTQRQPDVQIQAASVHPQSTPRCD
jgi:hypothetical protein